MLSSEATTATLARRPAEYGKRWIDAAAVGLEVRGGGVGAGRVQVLVAAEHVGAAAAVGLGRGEHDVVGAPDRAEQREVLALAGRLGELDVVDDPARAGLAQRVDGAGVQRARERPLLLEVGERDVVDRDDRELVLDLRAARLEAHRDGLVLDPVEHVRLLGHERQRQGGDRRDQDGYRQPGDPCRGRRGCRRRVVPAPDHGASGFGVGRGRRRRPAPARCASCAGRGPGPCPRSPASRCRCSGRW